MGSVTRPESIWNAISCPTVNSPSITIRAPNHRMARVDVFWIRCAVLPARLLRNPARKEERT